MPTEPTSPYLRYAARMMVLAAPLRGLDAAGLADRGLCLARWRRAGLAMPDLVDEREARRRAAIRQRLFPAPATLNREPSPAIDARIRFAGLRAFTLFNRELAAELANG